ncbi:hypothetical protein CB0940_08049 [Cercospora beticola]|uniref:AAA+ ATPase domain-containing protein n=1 Tax=Cercospora beticola TaxID=122368 RepID=A0A2G5HPL3_CERBT|nr:hypothetical protein CB0940_08049 [Cercospora beticola]PIA94172.1 hypothetical protein CB0940_08049 [Cercospora beticola]WPB04607.1 hypothetical protein RHO25_009253 [Cercospora beticola]
MNSSDPLDNFDFNAFLNQSNGMPSIDADLNEAISPPPPPGEKVPDTSISKGQIGTEIAVRQLYRKDPTEPWKPWKAGEDPDISKHAESLKYALVDRRERNSEFDEGLSLHSVTVQNPALRRLLATVFEGYRGFSSTTTNLTFRAPFHDFVHCWTQYETVQATIPHDSTESQVFTLFTSIIEPEIRPLLALKQDILREGQAEFQDAWLVFTPDTEVATTLEEGDRIYSFLSSRYTSIRDELFLELTVRHVGYDGVKFGWEQGYLLIGAYDGLKALHDLDAVPLQFHPRQQEIISVTTSRGRDFVNLQGWHYKAYSGRVIPADQRRRVRQIDHGRIVVDTAMYYSQTDTPSLLSALDPSALPPKDTMPPRPDPYFDPFAVTPRPKAKKSSKRRRKQVEAAPMKLSEDLYHLCAPFVKGYDMTTKQWATFAVDNIDDITFSAAAFKHLFLPHDYKDLILAFVQSHLNKEDAFDDVIEGKGQGMIMLLHGPPGLGKTLTAEAVAEEMKVPLYVVSAGQLGFDVETMEEKLQDVLDICAKWGAVLLLDEADVFLEQRQLTDLHRNRLVSIFLRLLEYYPGCLFLTTNRVAAFDRAFKSRIDLAIDYPPLDFRARHHIWQTFIRASEDFPQHYSGITDDEMFDLAELELNGREIKNLVKTGRLLAKSKGEQLGMGHLRSVICVQAGFGGDGSGLRYPVPDWFQAGLGRLVVQATMRVRRGISFA